MQKEIDLEQARAMVKGIDIPVQPAILMTIMKLQESDESNIGDYADAISRDVGLSASVLKTVNSPLFGLSNKISSIHQAVNMLGLSNVINLVIGISLRLEISGRFTVSVESFWDTSNDIALVSAGLSRALKIGSPDEAYLLGLFHDCGIPLLMIKHADYMETLNIANMATDKTVTQVEDEKYQTNHAVVGYYVAKSWRISERICNGILMHHEDDLLSSADEGQNALIAILKMAEAIRETVHKTEDPPEWERLHDRVFNYLSITDQRYVDIKNDMITLLSDAA